MSPYLTTQIIEKRLSYDSVIKKFPQYKQDIDKLLFGRGFTINEKGEAVKQEK